MEDIPYIAVSNYIHQNTNPPGGANTMDLRITTYDTNGHASLSFQWATSFNELVERILERIPPGGKVQEQTESRIKYTIGAWTKEIEVV